MSGEQSVAGGASAEERKSGGCLPGLGALLGIGLPILGLLMVLCTGGELAADQTGPGVGVIIVGLTIGIFLAGWVMRGRRTAGRKLAVGLPAMLVLAVAVGVVLASITGLLVRWQAPASYHARVGTQVTAQLTNGCEVDMPARITRGTTIEIECHDATWQADGQDRRGTIIVDGNDMTQGKAPAEIGAYVIDDSGYSVARTGRRLSIGSWGAAPLWPLLPALPLAVAAGYLLRRLQWTADATEL
jgi:hypothetical protein